MINKYATAVVIGAILGIVLFLLFDKRPEPETIVRVEEVIVRDTVVVREEVEVPVPVPTPVTVPIQQPDGTLVETPINRYNGTQIFEESGARLDYEIDATQLFRTHFSLEVPKITETKTITKEITKILPPKSRLFFGGGLDMEYFTKDINSAELGLMYNRRNKWQLGVGLSQDLTGLQPVGNRTALSFKFYIGL